ncbi:hypothetical protein [Crenobacter caeni]|uniref:SPOR domain-containing protein n=1 Tax=Crenobacter caeni TaxID=2705474 RepID=A0A6B2KQZ6_9NEIS|nr:hypothetical protein [Crenobacter caeni]NDV12665.1 hypothetical protein [Crenobacter caeni]
MSDIADKRKRFILAAVLAAAVLAAYAAWQGFSNATLQAAQQGPELLQPFTPSANTDPVAAYTPHPHSGKVTVLPRAVARAQPAAADASAPAEEALSELPAEEAAASPTEEAAPVAEGTQ